MKIVLKTELGIEDTAASRVREVGLSCTACPGHYKGLIVVDAALPDVVGRLEQIPEVSTILPVDAECSSDLPQIVACATEVAGQQMAPHESFAVRTTRRGTQPFSSIEVNVAVGEAICRQMGCEVDLEAPDRAVYVEIVGDTTFLSIRQGLVERRKSRAGVTGRDVTARTAIIQQVYLDRSDASMSMGVSIGRAAQAFGVQELVLALREPADAKDLGRFVEGVLKGRETRYRKCAGIAPGQTTRVPVTVADLYQTVRARESEPMVVMTALGNPLSVAHETVRTLYQQQRVNVLIGSAKGIPAGVARLAHAALNLSPGLTFATEHGIPAAIVGLVSCLQHPLG